MNNYDRLFKLQSVPPPRDVTGLPLSTLGDVFCQFYGDLSENPNVTIEAGELSRELSW
jgi:hypothetical protein